MRRAWLPRGVASAAAVLGVTALAAPALVSSACFGNECEGKGAQWTQGKKVDENTYMSTLFTDLWLPYTGNQTWGFETGPLFGARTVAGIDVYISADQNIGTEGTNGNFAPASGNLAEVSSQGSYFQVTNNTCASYFMWTVIRFVPCPTDAGPDAPSCGPPPAQDASSDAPADGLPDGAGDGSSEGGSDAADGGG